MKLARSPWDKADENVAETVEKAELNTAAVGMQILPKVAVDSYPTIGVFVEGAVAAHDPSWLIVTA